MTLKIFSSLIFVGMVLAWIGWLTILFYVDPTQTEPLGFLLFYFSLALALLGLFYLIGIFFRIKFQKKINIFLNFKTSFRQAIFFTILIIGTIFLQTQRILTWWNIILFILALTILEFFFVAKQKEIR